jgi:hypothetical protein
MTFLYSKRSHLLLHYSCVTNSVLQAYIPLPSSHGPHIQCSKWKNSPHVLLFLSPLEPHFWLFLTPQVRFIALQYLIHHCIPNCIHPSILIPIHRSLRPTYLRSSVPIRVSSKQTKKNFGSNRNKPKLSLFRLIFGLFRETNQLFFRFVSVRFGVSDPYRNNRNKQICFETTEINKINCGKRSKMKNSVHVTENVF